MFDGVLFCLCFFLCPCMAINLSVQYNGGLLPDIITVGFSQYNVLAFFLPDWGMLRRSIIGALCVCVCFLPIHSGHQVRWTYQPGSHRRKVTQDF